jgi:SAM-dependent methyltransferase
VAPARSAKAWVRECTPPVLYRAAARTRSRLRADAPGARLEDADADWYDHSFATHEHWQAHYSRSPWYYIWTVIVDRLLRMGRPAVLDIGCGPGQFAALLRDRGITRYTGIDFSPKRIEQARLVVPEFRFEVADAYTTPLFETADYDVAVSLEFLEHVTGDLDVLRRLRAGTKLIATVPNFGGGSHVRHFRTVDEVRQRYGELFEAFQVDCLIHPSGSEQFLFEGVARSSVGVRDD